MANLHVPSLRQLRAFLAVAESGSFSQAAQQLSLSQPAVSALTAARWVCEVLAGFQKR